MAFGRFRERRAAAGPQIEISEQRGVRSLHLNSDTIQSSMKLADPYALVLVYTRVMLSFLLFKPEPRDVWIVGLGGGSLPKFIYRHLPMTRCRVLELHPEMLSIARTQFALPPDDNRMNVIIADGADYMTRHEAATDVIMIDGFDGQQIAPELATESFFLNCARSLRDDGVFAMNLWGSDKAFHRHIDAIAAAFERRILLIPAREKGNVIALAFKQDQGEPRWETLRDRARVLQQRYGVEFLDFVSDMRSMNLCSDKRLLI